MKVLYNRTNANVSFDRGNGSRVHLGPRGTANDHIVLEDQEAELPGILGLLRSRRVMLLNLEESRQLENRRKKKIAVSEEVKVQAEAKVAVLPDENTTKAETPSGTEVSDTVKTGTPSDTEVSDTAKTKAPTTTELAGGAVQKEKNTSTKRARGRKKNRS